MQSTHGQQDHDRYEVSHAAQDRAETYLAMRASPPPGPAYDSEGEWDEQHYAEHHEGDDEDGDGEGEREDEEEEDEEEGAGDDEEEYAASETSSAMYDPAADPEGFARRQDELAGVLEMGEEEARALKWGPNIGRGLDRTQAGRISTSNLKEIITHHLNTTEWKYKQPGGMNDPAVGRDDAGVPFADQFGAIAQGNHPIRVSGRSGVSTGDIGPSDLGPLRNGLGIEGLPMSTR